MQYPSMYDQKNTQGVLTIGGLKTPTPTPTVNTSTPTQTTSTPTSNLTSASNIGSGVLGAWNDIHPPTLPPPPTPPKIDPSVGILDAWKSIHPPAPTPPPPNVTAAPNTGIDRDSLQREAAARIAKLRAGVEGAVTAGKASRTNLNNYNNTLTQNSRTLRNFDYKNRNDPFSGNTKDVSERVQMQDGVNDTFTNNAYTNDINALNAQLTSFDTLAPEQQQTLYNDLLRQERDYGLQEGALTGTLNGQRTLAGQAQDYNQSPTNPQNQGQVLQNQGQAQQNLLNQYKIDSYPAEQKAAAEKIQLELQSGKLDLEAAKYNFEILKDPKSATNMAKAYDAEIKKLELAALPEMQRQELAKIKKTIADIGVTHYKPQTDAEKQYDEQQVKKIKAEIDKIKSDTNGKTLSGKPINVKLSADNYGLLTQDIADAKDLAEAYTLIESNSDTLTDADYKTLKEDARKHFGF